MACEGTTRALSIAALVVCAWGAAGQTPNVELPDRLVIRAQLDRGISAANTKPGERVYMHAVAAEMDGDRVLIASGAKLIGRVLAATKLSDATPESRLDIVIERAEWRHHSVNLRAYIIEQGVIITSKVVGCGPPSSLSDEGTDLKPRDTLCSGNQVPIYKREPSPVMQGVEIRYLRDRRGGPTALVSKTHNVVLPPGLAVLIRHDALPQ